MILWIEYKKFKWNNRVRSNKERSKKSPEELKQLKREKRRASRRKTRMNQRAPYIGKVVQRILVRNEDAQLATAIRDPELLVDAISSCPDLHSADESDPGFSSMEITRWRNKYPPKHRPEVINVIVQRADEFIHMQPSVPIKAHPVHATKSKEIKKQTKTLLQTILKFWLQRYDKIILTKEECNA